MKAVAEFISLVFHPLLMPTYAFLYVMYINPYEYGGWNSPYVKLNVLQVLINSFMFPVVTFFLMKGLGFIDSFKMEKREERILPLIACLVFYTWTFVVFLKSESPEILSDIMLAALLGLSIAFVITAAKSKISLHGIGAGIFFSLAILSLGFAKINAIPFLLAITFICGLIGTSRLILNAHTDKELYSGFLVGMFAMSISVLF